MGYQKPAAMKDQNGQKLEAVIAKYENMAICSRRHRQRTTHGMAKYGIES